VQQAFRATPRHPQRYLPLAKAGEVRRRLQRMHPENYAGDNNEVLDENNTHPLKIHIDWSSTRPATAMANRSCFRTGDWFRPGLVLPRQRSLTNGNVVAITANSAISLATGAIKSD
jgi:hypothetical protein